MTNPFIYSLDNKRYHTLNYYYKCMFGCKVFKVSLNGGFTCPNIDGTKGYGGCIYCSKSGSGEYAGNKNDSITTQFYKIKDVMDKKWHGKYIAYFQARTNTYAPVDKLKDMYEEVLKISNVIGISIATRCDAISLECLDYLTLLNKKTFLTIELGLQTIHEKTSKLINRGHTLDEFTTTFNKLKERGIRVVVHIINGLPYETEDMMLDTVRYINRIKPDGIKIHMLNIIRDTPLEQYYNTHKFHVLTKDEYIDIVIKQLELLDKDIVIHRITSDPCLEELIEPMWLVNKTVLLNDIDKEMKKRNTYQGIKA